MGTYKLYLRGVNKIATCIFILIVFIRPVTVRTQTAGIDEDISRFRKGTLVIQGKAGDVVKVEQLTHEFWFGCAIGNGFVGASMSDQDKKQYHEKFLQNFNAAVTENAVKWGSMERVKGQVDYSAVDGILEWTEKNKIPLRAHNLFWGIPKFVQPWVKEMDDSTLRQTLQNRAKTITKKYKGRFVEYDLNNEMVHGNYYEERLGPEITKLMAQWAHEGDKDAKLFLNDYDILTGNKLPEYMTQIRTFLSMGVPLAGIGVQGHLHTDTFDRQQLKNALDSLAIFKLPIRITEFNMPGQRSKYHRENIREMTSQEEELKAKELVDYYKICFAHPAVEGMLMWGFWAGANWIPVSSLYRKDWSLTPAAEAYQNLIFKEWWTTQTATLNSTGKLAIPAFYGKYRITINGKSRETDLAKKSGKAIVDLSN